MIRCIGLIGAILALSCSGDGNGDKAPTSPPQPTTQPSPQVPTTSGAKPVTQSVCATTRKAIETRNFAGWTGLPAECAASDLFDQIPADFSDRPTRMLGSRSAHWVLLDLAGYYRPMASFVDGKLVMFDAMNPELAVAVEELQKQLGAPAAKEDWWYGTVEMKDAAYVYPQQGITLFINPETGEALHVALYHPTDLGGWNDGLRPRLRKHAR